MCVCVGKIFYIYKPFLLFTSIRVVTRVMNKKVQVIYINICTNVSTVLTSYKNMGKTTCKIVF